MSLLVVAALLGLAPQAPSDPAMAACQTRIARKVEGEISQASVVSNRHVGKSRTLSGQITALLGMGDPGPGMASAHHLIRSRYRYVCTVRAGKVVKLKVSKID